MEIWGTGLKSLAGNSLPREDLKPRLPWVGGDLQTLRTRFRLDAPVFEPEDRLPISIGEAGALNLAVNAPASGAQQQSGLNRGLLLIHGLGGSEDSGYMRVMGDGFARAGWTIYRLNMRGVGPSRTSSLPPYHAGLASDLRAVIGALCARHADGMAAVGFSLGGHQLLRLLGEGDVPAGLKAAGSVSAPLDLAAASRLIERPRNRPYRGYLTRKLQEQLAGTDHPAITADIARLKSVLEIDHHVVAPVFGYEDAWDYYARASALPLLGNVKIPLLSLHAQNDPWISADDYRRAPWPSDVPAGALLTRDGGHVGFHHKSTRTPWYLDVMLGFLGLQGWGA